MLNNTLSTPCSVCNSRGFCEPNCPGWGDMLDKNDVVPPAREWARMAVARGFNAFEDAYNAADRVQQRRRTASIESLWDVIKSAAR